MHAMNFGLLCINLYCSVATIGTARTTFFMNKKMRCVPVVTRIIWVSIFYRAQCDMSLSISMKEDVYNTNNLAFIVGS